MPNDLFTGPSQASLLLERRAAGPDLAAQQRLAPLEHQAFAREIATEHPLQAVGMLGAIPAYQGAKALGLMKSRTGTTQPLAQMWGGYKGLAQGWANAANRGLGATLAKLAPVQPADDVFAPSPAEVVGQQLDAAKAAIPERPKIGRYQYTRGGQWGAAQVLKANALQDQYEAALGNPGAAQNDPRLVPELGTWGARAAASAPMP